MLKVSFDDLLRKKLLVDEKKSETIDIEVFEGKALTFKRLPEERIFDIIDGFDSSRTTKAADELIRTIIYECCDELHNEELHRKLGVVDPLDIVTSLFDHAERTRIGEELVRFLKLDGEGIEEKIKNA